MVRFDFGLSPSEQGGGFLQASAPASHDLAADVETWYSRQCRKKPTQALRGRNLGRDIPVDSAPIARQWCGQSRRTLLRRDWFLDSHWTPIGLPLDAGVDASKNPPFWTDATKIREEPRIVLRTAIAKDEGVLDELASVDIPAFAEHWQPPCDR